MKMNPEVKQRWLAALRSGFYQQGKHSLSKGGAFCCLGVLCDLHSKETGTQWLAREGDNMYFDDTSYVPEHIFSWAGIASNNPLDLATLNDDGASFEAIANKIEVEL